MGCCMTTPSVLTGLAWLLLCQLAGELLSMLVPLGLPGPVLGMLVLALSLTWERLRTRAEAHIRLASDALLAHLSLLFVPVGVGVMTHMGLIAAHGVRLVLVLVLSTWIGLLTTAWVLQFALRGQLVEDQKPKPTPEPGND